MFKKEVKTSAFNRISNKDRNAIKVELMKAMDGASVEKFFADNKNLSCKKVVDSRVLIYLTDQYPALVEDGKGKHFPTLYTLSQYPGMLPCLIMKQSVEAFIFKGANLMWPGVLDVSELGYYQEGTIVAIVMFNRTIVGVGEMTSPIKNTSLGERVGVACTSLHFLGDRLSVMGDYMMLVKPTVAPTKKLVEYVIKPKESTKVINDSIEVNKPSLEQPEEHRSEFGEDDLSEEGSWSGNEDEEDIYDDYDEHAHIQEEEKKVEPPKLTPAEMSNYFRYALLSAIYLNRPPKSNPQPKITLPMDSGHFFSEYIKQACPISIGLDIHKSTYKKLSNFYDAMEKYGLLTTKDRKNKGTTVTSIITLNYNYEGFTDFQPLVKKIRGNIKADSGDKLYPLDIKLDIKAVPMVCANSQVFWMFAELPQAKIKKEVLEESDFIRNADAETKIYQLRDFKSRFHSFVSRCMVHRSEHPDNKLVDITLAKNPFLMPLCTFPTKLVRQEVDYRRMHFKRDQKYEAVLPEYIKPLHAYDDKSLRFKLSRNDFERRVLDAVEHYHSVSFNEDEPPQLIKGRMKAINIFTVKQGNKLVTWLTGLQTFIRAKDKEQEMAAFCQFLSVRFACGASCCEFRGSGKEIMVQGDFVMKLVRMVQEGYGISREYVTYVLPKRRGKGKPKK